MFLKLEVELAGAAVARRRLQGTCHCLKGLREQHWSVRADHVRLMRVRQALPVRYSSSQLQDDCGKCSGT